MFRFFCSNCGNKLKATDELVGQQVECAHCGTVITVPPPDSKSSSEAQPKKEPDGGWARTQEISRSALRKNAASDAGASENLLDLINEQVDLDELSASYEPKKAAPAAPGKPMAVATPSEEIPPSTTDVAVPINAPAPPTSTKPAGANKYRAGTVVGNFEIGYLLGEGAMGQVFAAKQLSMDRQVALKILPPEIMHAETAAAEQFRNEVKMLAKLDHHNIVTAFEAGEDNGIYYLAMAFINGKSLETLLDEEPIVDEEQALMVIVHVANALQYSWDTFKMLHQDVKPANIMIDDQGEVKLMDMGIATMANKDGAEKNNTFVLGTPHYMSPEQASGQGDLDWRSDQYSLGCTLYRMVTGEVPFPGDDPTDVMKKHFSAPLPPAKTKNPNVSQKMNDLLKRMLAKTRDRRYQSWAELIAALGETVSASRRHKKALANKSKKGTDKNKPVGNASRKKRTKMKRGRSGGACVPRRNGLSPGQFLGVLVGIVFGFYLLVSLVNRAGILKSKGLNFPQKLFLPPFRNERVH